MEDAHTHLHFSTSTGEGVLQDYVEAVRWHRLAAEQNHALAIRNLGAAYRDGQGVQPNLVQAHMWYNIASALWQRYGAFSRDGAAESRDELEEDMTSDQITEAERLAVEWEAAHPREP